MKFAVSLASLVAVTSAFPLITRDDNTTRTELEAGSASACPKAILIYARGTIQEGNMVSILCLFLVRVARVIARRKPTETYLMVQTANTHRANNPGRSSPMRSRPTTVPRMCGSRA
jgi:hypothetical protein